MGNIGSLGNPGTTACRACHPLSPFVTVGFRAANSRDSSPDQGGAETALSQGSFFRVEKAACRACHPCRRYVTRLFAGRFWVKKAARQACHRYVTLSVTAGFAGFRHGFSACVDVTVLSPPWVLWSQRRVGPGTGCGAWRGLQDRSRGAGLAPRPKPVTSHTSENF